MKGASVVVTNPNGEILLLRRGVNAPWMPGKWNLPGGVINEGETAEKAAVREVLEEANIHIRTPLAEIGERPYGKGTTVFFVTPSYRGTVKLNHEHDDYVWARPTEVGRYDLTPGTRDVVYRATKIRATPPGKQAATGFDERTLEVMRRRVASRFVRKRLGSSSEKKMK